MQEEQAGMVIKKTKKAFKDSKIDRDLALEEDLWHKPPNQIE